MLKQVCKRIGGFGLSDNAVLHWIVRDGPVRVVYKGEISVGQEFLQWTSDASSLIPWSDKNPKLYQIEVCLSHNGTILDVYSQSFGLRLLERDKTKLTLNGAPVFLRGATEHAYFHDKGHVSGCFSSRSLGKEPGKGNMVIHET